MTDHATALATAKQAFRDADHAYDIAAIKYGYAKRALHDADYVLRKTTHARKTAAMKVRHAAVDMAKGRSRQGHRGKRQGLIG